MPNNWKTYKLKEIAKLSTGFAFKSKDYELSGNLKVIRGKNITEGYLRWDDDSRYWNHSIEKLEKYLVQLDDIVIGMDGSKIGKNRAIVRESDLPSILAQRVGRVQSKDGVSCQKFLWQLINNNNFESYVENVQTGTSIPHISLGQIGDLEVNLPPLPEQKAIANILSAIGDKIENNLAINNTLEDMAMALYKHWFVDFGPFQEGEFIESELGPIPKGWEVKSISEVFEVRDGTHDSPKRKEEGYFLITSKHLKGNQIDYSSAYKISKEDFDKVNNRSLVEKGDILMTMIGTVGNFFFVNHEPNYAIKNIGLFKTSQTPNLQYYVYSFFKSKICQDYIKAQMSGSTQQYITLKTLRNFPIIFPSNIVIEKYSTLVKSNFEKIDSNIKVNQSLTKLRDTLLPKLISGEVRLKEFQKQIESVL